MRRNRVRSGAPLLPYTAIDLFAGAGGATEGLKRAGFDLLAAVEIERDAAQTYALNHPEVRLLIEDIQEVDANDLREVLGINEGALTLLKACPPCQGFSTLGTSALEDVRNDLILQVWRFVRAFYPSAFVIENVPGIRSDHRLALLIRQARAVAYRVRTFEVNATDFGVPQHRRRHIVLGLRRGPAEFPVRFDDLIPRKLRSAPLAAGLTLDKVTKHRPSDSLDRGRTSRPSTLKRIRAVPIGGRRSDLPPELQLECHKRLGRRAATGPYGRVRLDAPAPTLTTRCTTPSCGPFIHPLEDRGLTLREAAVLQTFPMSYRFAGGYDSIERQIGNAVPVRMATGIGHGVRHLINGQVRCEH